MEEQHIEENSHKRKRENSDENDDHKKRKLEPLFNDKDL